MKMTMPPMKRIYATTVAADTLDCVLLLEKQVALYGKTYKPKAKNTDAVDSVANAIQYAGMAHKLMFQRSTKDEKFVPLESVVGL